MLSSIHSSTYINNEHKTSRSNKTKKKFKREQGAKVNGLSSIGTQATRVDMLLQNSHNNISLSCQLGGATDDAVIIRNLPLHLADATRTWLEHLPVDQIHD